MTRIREEEVNADKRYTVAYAHRRCSLMMSVMLDRHDATTTSARLDA